MPVAALAPSLRLQHSVHRLDGALSRVEVSLENHGFLPTTILESAKALDFAEPLAIAREPLNLELVDPGPRHVVVGQLEAGQRPPRQLPLRGRGELRLRAGSCRVGWVEKDGSRK